MFVDSTGRRRRVLRRLSWAFGAICVVYGGLVSVSLAGGPVSPSTVLPLPNLDNDDGDQAEIRTNPVPTPTSTKLITEALPPRAAPLRRPIEHRNVAPRPAPVKAAPPRTPAPRTPTRPPVLPTSAPTRPVESTVMPSPSGSATPTPILPTPIKGMPTIPAAPLPPAVTEGGGGGAPVIDLDSTDLFDSADTDDFGRADDSEGADDSKGTDDSEGADSESTDGADFESLSPEPEGTA